MHQPIRILNRQRHWTSTSHPLAFLMNHESYLAMHAIAVGVIALRARRFLLIGTAVGWLVGLTFSSLAFSLLYVIEQPELGIGFVPRWSAQKLLYKKESELARLRAMKKICDAAK